MADEDDASKTEQPTGKKLSKAREKGNVAQSQEIKTWFILLGGAFGLVLFVPGMMRDVSLMGITFIETSHAIPFDFEHLRLMLSEVMLEMGLIVAPMFALLMFMAIVGNIGQVGLLWTTEKLKPNLSKFNIIKNAKQKMSLSALVEFAKGILKLLVVSVVAFGLVVPQLDDITLFPTMELSQLLERLHLIVIWLVIGTLAVLTVIAILDYVYQKYKFTKDMKMTKQEVKDEHKAAEGDPQIKARIRRLRVERFQQRMMAAVPEADVVITNPTHYAVALEYKIEEMPAPKLVAKGMDSLAQRIRAVAEEHEVPVVENPPLARLLYAAVEVGEEIPPEHYQAVAEIIGYVMRMRGDLPAEPPAPPGP